MSVWCPENAMAMAAMQLSARYLEEAKVAAIAHDTARYEMAMRMYELAMGRTKPTDKTMTEPDGKSGTVALVNQASESH